MTGAVYLGDKLQLAWSIFVKSSLEQHFTPALCFVSNSASWLSTLISHNIKPLTGEVNNIDNLVTGIVPLGNMFQAFMWKPLDTHIPLKPHCRTCTPPLAMGPLCVGLVPGCLTDARSDWDLVNVEARSTS